MSLIVRQKFIMLKKSLCALVNRSFVFSDNKPKGEIFIVKVRNFWNIENCSGPLLLFRLIIWIDYSTIISSNFDTLRCCIETHLFHSIDICKLHDFHIQSYFLTINLCKLCWKFDFSDGNSELFLFHPNIVVSNLRRGNLVSFPYLLSKG